MIEDSVLENAKWFKSRRSGAAGHCVEVAFVGDRHYAGVRNSRMPDGAALVFTGQEWDAFVAGVKAGEFDRT